MLNKLSLSKIWWEKAILAFIIFALLTGLNCGKRKPPLPPIEKIRQRVEISGSQRGNVITLRWTLPIRNASDKSTLNIARADIYRLAEPINNSLTLSEEEFATKSTLISTLPITNTDFDQKQITYDDILEFANQPVRLRYAIRFANASGQKAAFSNFLLIEPIAKVASSPASLNSTISEQAIQLDWIAPNINIDGTKPANILGYNIYRADSNTDIPVLLNPYPITDMSFNDKNFEFEKAYEYFVRTVSLGSNGELVESLNSNKVEVKPIDTFAPSPPSAITIAAAPNNLSIFFAVNVEKDIVGYNIFRTTNPNQPKSQWMLITKETLLMNTFQDFAVESGKTYYYYLTAIDRAGNISQSSEVVSETTP
jgi:hypothetical protein